jgi:shikimate dehydrogenase
MALRDAGHRDGLLVARNPTAGPALAGALGYRWLPEPAGARGDLLVNVTPIGMAGGAEADEPAFAADQVAAAGWVFDVVAMPPETPLIRLARAAAKPVITGAEVIVLQAVEQFALYTGVRPSPPQIEAAAAVALAP